MNIDELIKIYVGSICKSTESVEVLISNDIMVVCIDDTSLCIIPIEINTNIYTAFKYGDSWGNKNDALFSKLIGYWERYDQLSRYTQTIGYIEDLRVIPEYESLLARKADEGLGIFKMPSDTLYKNIMISVFTGFPVLVKGDKIGVKVNRINDETLLMQYCIYKKKLKKNITQWCRILDMDRPISRNRSV